jgi:hypothetical protein
MTNPTVTDEDFLKELDGRLWHTTTPKRFMSIRSGGSILPDPYVRTLGGVSLFDFADFDPTTYNDRYPFSTWREFVPFRDEVGSAVWLEVDREKVAGSYIDPISLMKKWKKDGANLRHIAMPEIEGAHIGALPTASLLRVVVISRPRKIRPLAASGESHNNALERTRRVGVPRLRGAIVRVSPCRSTRC